MLQERKKPTFAQSFSQGISQGLEKFQELKQMQQQKQQQMEAAKKLGFDPSVLSLPKEAQAEYFKSQFSPEKSLNPLQQAQLNLANQKTENLKATGSLFERISGKKPLRVEEESEESHQVQNPFNGMDDEELITLASFKGQPGEAGIIGTAAQNQLDKKESNKKQDQHEKEFFHKETEEFDKSLSNQVKAAQTKNRALDRQLKDVDKIGWFDRAVSSLFGSSPWGDLLRSSTAQEFDSNTLAQMQGQRELLGGILSDSDIRLLMQKIVTASKDPKANRAIASNMKMENDLIIAKKEIADKLKKENKGYRPAGYEAEIEKRYLEKYGDEIRNNFEQIMSLPDDTEKLKQIYRRQVHPGTPLNDEIVETYMKIANGDAELASQMAGEDGYFIPE